MPTTDRRLRLRLRVAAAIIVTLVLLADAALCFYLASIPARFGHRTGAGFASVELSLCALDRDGSARILVAGDSRAKCQVSPAALTEASGLRAVNVAEDLNLGGDPATLVNALRKAPRVLESHPVILLSLSLDGINDMSYANTPMATVLNYRPDDHARLLIRAPLGYTRYLFGTFIPFIRRESVHMRRGDGFACDEDAHLPPKAQAALGYRPFETPKRPVAPRGKHPGYLLDGGRLRMLRESLDWLSKSPAAAVILYNAPIDTSWILETAGPEALEAQRRFSALLAAEAPRHARTFLWDFAREPFPGLTREEFFDPDHLNEPGARIFSAELGRRLADFLRKNP